MQILASLVLAAFAVGAAKAQTITGQYTQLQSGQWLLSQNQYGAGNGVGSQNSTLIHASADDISWSTTYTWAGNPNDVKSFANVEQLQAKNVALAQIVSVPTGYVWEYEYESSGLRADVSYDIWLGISPGEPASSTSRYEIKIWLSGEGGIHPIGSEVESGVSVGGYTWNLWSGHNSNWQTISFVSANGNINNFQSDLNDFFQWVINNERVPSSSVLQAIQSGTEVYTGTATLLIESFDVSVHTK